MVLSTTAFQYEDDEGQYSASALDLFVQDGYLYYTADVHHSQVEYAAGMIDLTTGEKTIFQTDSITGLSPWKGGMLLCTVYDKAKDVNFKNWDVMGLSYGLYNPKTDTFTWKGELPYEYSGTFAHAAISGLCGDPATDTLYYSAGNRIMRLNMATGEKSISAYAGDVSYWKYTKDQHVLLDGYYAIRRYEWVTLRGLNTASESSVLRIFGELGSDAHKSFSKNYPDIPVDVEVLFGHGMKYLSDLFTTENNFFDVLRLPMCYLYEDRLLENGYCTDLSEYAEVMDIVKQMNPSITEHLLADGKLYAVPVSFTCAALGVNVEYWEAIGLTHEDLPTNLPELMNFIAHWKSDYAGKFPDIKLLNTLLMDMPLDYMFSLRANVFAFIMDHYISYMRAQSEPLTFDTELFRNLLIAYEKIDFVALEGEFDPANFHYVSDEPALLDLVRNVGNLNRHFDVYEPILLAVEEGKSPVLQADVRVLVINSKTEKMEQAMLYVANHLRNLDADSASITLFPNRNVPVESNLYTISPEQILNYRENFEPYLWVDWDNTLSEGGQREFGKFILKYLQGTLTMDQLIQEMDKQLLIMEFEEQ